MNGSAFRASTQSRQQHPLPRIRMGWAGVAFGISLVGVFLAMFLVTFAGVELPSWILVSAFGLILALVVAAVATGVIARRTDHSSLGLIAIVVACLTGIWLLLGLTDMLFSKP